jgi:hypothetical protein
LYSAANERWVELILNIWVSTGVYRGKPAPKKITYYCHVYKSIISMAFNTREECKEGEMCGSLGILQVDIINDTPTFTFIPKDKTK